MAEAAEALSLFWDAWQEHVAPHVRMVRVGRRRRVPVAELERYLAERAELTLPEEVVQR